MARADYEGVPTVEARIQAPDDYQRVNASPDAFGAALARGGEEAGAGLLKLSDFYGATAASQATTNFVTERQKILTGDPSNMVAGPDGQPTVDGGYLGLTGQAALDARESTLQKLDDLYAQTASTLKTPQSRDMFANEARRYLAQAQVDIGGHYTQQSKVWAENTSNEAATVNLGLIGANPSIPNPAAEDSIRQSYVRLAQIMPEKYGSTNGALLKANRDIAAARIRGQIAADPIASVKTYRDNKDVLAGTPLGLELNRQASDAAALQLQGIYSNPNNMAGFGFSAADAQKVPITPGAPLSKVETAAATTTAQTFQAKGWSPEQSAGITANLFSESGLSSNPKGSNDGGKAFGLAQWHADRQADFAAWAGHPIQQSTIAEQQGFVNYELTQGKYKSVGDQLKNATTPEQAAQIVMLGFERPGDKGTQAVSERQALARQIAGGKNLGTNQSGGGDLSSAGGGADVESTYLNFVRGKATEVFPDEPGIVEHVVRGVQSDLQSNFAIGAASARTGVENDLTNADAEVGAGQAITGKIPTVADIYAAYPRDPEKAAATVQWRDDVMQVSSLVTGMVDKTPAQLKQVADSVQPDPAHPETFARQQHMAKLVDDAIGTMVKARASDPGNWVVMTHPDVAALGAKVWGPGGHIEDYGAFADAVTSHLKAVGVADQDISILPKPIAVGMVRGLEQDPTKSYDQLKGMESKLGNRFPQFFQDLVKQGGLSPDYQMVAQLDPVNGGFLARAYGEPGKNNGKRIDDSLAAPTITSVRKFVDADPKLKQVEDSLTASSGSKAMRDSLHNAVQTLTFARMIYKGEDQATAEGNAVKSFTSQWDIMPNGGARVPHGRMDDVSYNADATMRWVSKGNILDGLGRPVSDDYVRILQASPSWVTSPNGDAIQLMDPQGKIVRQAKDGQPVAVAFKYRKVTTYVPTPHTYPRNVDNQ